MFHSGFFVTIHSRNAHKLRIYDPIQWIVQAFAPRRRRLFMRKCHYYEQPEAVNNNIFSPLPAAESLTLAGVL